ncbi:MAG: nucleotide exchange factor GrpE [bacterium]
MKKKNSPKTPSEIEELKASWQRCQADFDNYKRRVETEKAIWSDQAKIELMQSLLPILDNLVLMSKHQPAELKENAWVQGVSLIAKQIESALENEGIEKIIPKIGDDFDPNIQEAVSAIENKQIKSGKIVKVQKPGYKIGDKLIRPAHVITSK